MRCNTPFPAVDDLKTVGAVPERSGMETTTMLRGTPAPLMERGTVLGRYEIVGILGQGGMGAVYKAKDRELDRLVALKVIQPELVSSSAILKRFKQELILARQITHKNVVRIFDFGDADGLKFITMEYLDGGDLKSHIIERGKIPPAEAVDIVRQICNALEAAHSAGVVHRDLKPQNIMIESTGRVVVMDFGIAHSKEMPGLTMTGALMGTPEYMSPEQAKGEKTDIRADIFAVGIIFYEMLTGKVPFRASTIVETMYKRTQERAVPPVDLDQSVPVQANQIVMKCLETDPANRYQSVKEILQDLEIFDPEQYGLLDRARRSVARRSKRIAIVAAALAVLVIAVIAGVLFQSRFSSAPGTPRAAITVLISDFSNHTGDPIFDGALEPVVKIALEGAGFITAYDRTQMRNLGLQAISGRFDEQAARKIAVGQGLGVVISGVLDRKGAGYALSLKATQTVTGNTIGSAEETASNKDQVVFATTKLASAVRNALGDDTSDSAQRFAMETLSATSLEAIYEYAKAMDALSNGKLQDALRGFSKAVDIDQDFGMAYAAMASASRNLGQQQDAEKYIKLALGHLDRMTERERYRTRGFYYLLISDPEKCVEEYGALISRFPSDAAAHNNVAFCWSQLRNMPKALEEVRQAAAILPKRLLYRFNVSIYASYASDFQSAEREARALQELDASSPLGFSALAWAQLGQGQSVSAAETYQKLETFSPVSASDARAGLADLAWYEGRFADAARLFEQGAMEDLAAKRADRAAAKLAGMAYTRLSQGQKGPAVAAADRALSSSTTLRIKFLAGRLFAMAGQTARAEKLAAELASDVHSEPQAYAKVIEGEIALASGDPRAAIKAFTDANNLVDTWIGRFGLGRAYLESGAFTEADSEFDRCIKRRGEALSLFNEESTYGHFPTVYYYLGRVREGLKTAGFAESYRTYLSIRAKAGEDPLLADVRKRAGL
jgi:tetratricopeptide (TPR) repeat protein/predicted Ser/Thr protein kinase